MPSVVVMFCSVLALCFFTATLAVFITDYAPICPTTTSYCLVICLASVPHYRALHAIAMAHLYFYVSISCCILRYGMLRCEYYGFFCAICPRSTE